MRSQQWKTYRTRFLVKAKQLSSSLTFTDHLGRQHCGRKGDYLVESNDGVVSITPRRIFEDIYVPMSYLEQPRREHLEHNLGSDHADEIRLKDVVVEPLEIERFHLKSAAGETPYRVASATKNSRALAANLRSPSAAPVPPPN